MSVALVDENGDATWFAYVPRQRVDAYRARGWRPLGWVRVDGRWLAEMSFHGPVAPEVP